MPTAFYNGIQTNSPIDDCGERFKFLEAWKVLWTHPKFAIDVRSLHRSIISSSKTTKAESKLKDKGVNKCTDVEGNGTLTKSELPVGRNPAIVEVMKRKHYETKLKITKGALLLQKKRTEELKRHNDIALFTASSDTSPDAIEFFRITCKRVWP